MKVVNNTRYDTTALRTAICMVHDRIAKTEGRLPKWKRVTVEVVYARTRTTHGYAYLNGTYMRLRLIGPRKHSIHRGSSLSRVTAENPLACPHCGGGAEVFRPTCREVSPATGETTFQHYEHKCNVMAPSAVTPQELAALIDHEMRHLYGFNHCHMRGVYTKTMWNLEHAEAVWAIGHPAFPWAHLPERVVKAKPVRDLVSERHERVLARERAWLVKLKRAQTALSKIRVQKRYYAGKMAARGQGGTTPRTT